MKQDKKEFSSFARSFFTIASIVLGLAIMLVAFFVSQNKEVRDPDIINWQGAFGIEILIAIGTSILASILFYFIYSHSAEKKILHEISESASEYAISLFANRYEKLLPAKIFPESSYSTEDFEREFSLLFNSSKTYKYKGDTAKLSSFRLTNLYDSEHPLEKDIKFLLLDPREDALLEERALVELAKSRKPYSKQDVEKKVEEIRNEIYLTIVSLYDNCHKHNVEIALHTEQLFFRTELFDNGMFISYYLGRGFPDTYLYKKNTLSYDSYLLNFRQNYRISKTIIYLNSSLNEESFLSKLEELECKSELSELRALVNKRNNEYQKLITFRFNS